MVMNGRQKESLVISKDAERIAVQCRPYAMCKIDFLGTGLCPSGHKKPFVSYYRQGRMDIYPALGNGLIPMAEGLIDAAQSCTLCGVCDQQCHFVIGLPWFTEIRKPGGRMPSGPFITR